MEIHDPGTLHLQKNPIDAIEVKKIDAVDALSTSEDHPSDLPITISLQAIKMPPATKESQELLQIGDAILAPPSGSKTTQAMEVPTQLSSSVAAQASKLVTTVSGDQPAQISALSVQELTLAVEIGMHAVKLFENNEKIDKARDSIAHLEAKVDNLERKKDRSQSDTDEIARLKHDISISKEEIASEIRLKQKSIERIITASLQESAKGTQEGSDIALEISSHAAKGAHIASSVGGSVFSILSVVLSSKALDTNRKIAKNIAIEKKSVLEEMKTYKGASSSAMRELAALRVRNLDFQLEQNKVNTAKNAFSLTAGVLGTAVAAKTAAVALGATVCATLGITATATGIGAVVIGVGAILVGSGYLVYKNRKALEHSLKNTSITVKESSAKREIKKLEGKEKEVSTHVKIGEKIFKSTVVTLADIKKLDALCLDELKDIEVKIAKLQGEAEQMSAFNPASGIAKDREIEKLRTSYRQLINQRTTFALYRSQIQQKAFQYSQKHQTKLDTIDKKIGKQEQNLQMLGNQRQQLVENYRYGKDIAKFAKNESGKDISIKELASIHSKMCPSGFNTEPELSRVKDFFTKQNARTQSTIDAAAFRTGIDREKFWDLLVIGITAPIK